MAKAKKLPSGNWRCQVYMGKDNSGKNIYKSVTAESRKEAEYLAAELRLKRKERSKPALLTLSEAIDKYCQSKSNVLSPSTIRGYRSVQRNSLQSIMCMRICDIDSMKLQIAINEDAAHLSEKTLRNAVGLVKTVMKIYMPDTAFNVSLPQKRKYEAATLNVRQLQIFLKALQGDELEFAVLCAVWLGLRASEICALSWDDYDPEKKTIFVRHAIVPNENNEFVTKGTKTTESTRMITLAPYLCELLDKMEHTNDDMIVPVRPATVRKRAQKICRENGLPVVRLHDMRHCNASIMLLLGIPQKYAMERGGWSSAQTMEKIYQHTFEDEKQAVDKKINDFFDKLLSE